MNSRLFQSLITRVVLGLVLVVAGLLTLMAARAGLVAISPDRVFMGIFILIVGGALFSLFIEFLAVPGQAGDQVTAEADGSK